MPLVKDTIFDLDGTLVDSAPGIIECVKQTLLEQDILFFPRYPQLVMSSE